MLIFEIHRAQVCRLNARTMLFCLSGAWQCWSCCITHQTKKTNLSNSNLKQYQSFSLSANETHAIWTGVCTAKSTASGHRTAHGGSKEAATPEQELVRELEAGARLARHGICCPIWADGDNGQTATINVTRSLGDFGVACRGAAAPRRTDCTPSGSSKVARRPNVQQRPNPAPGPLPGPSDCQGNGRWVVFLLPGFDPTGLFPVRLSEVANVQRQVQNSCRPQGSRGTGGVTGSYRHVQRRDGKHS